MYSDTPISARHLSRLLVLLPVLLHAFAAAAAVASLSQPPPPDLSPRQAAVAAAQQLPCPAYAAAANHTVVGLNSTLRGAFLRSLPGAGTDAAASLLDDSPGLAAGGSAAGLAALAADADLNARCGNLTAAAELGASLNFSSSPSAPPSVLGVGVVEALGPDPGDLVMPVVSVAILFIFGVPLLSI